MSSTSIDKIQKKAKVEGRPSFKNIINIEKEKVRSCDKSKDRCRAKSQSKINTIVNEQKIQKQEPNQKTNQVQIKRNTKIQQKVACKIVQTKENHIEQNIVHQLIKVNRKVGKIDDKLNDQQKKVYKIYSLSIKMLKENGKRNNKTNYGQSIKRLQKSKNFLSDYLEQLNKQTQQIQEGYLSKLQAFQNLQINKFSLQNHELRSIRQLIAPPQMAELESKLNRLEQMLF